MQKYDPHNELDPGEWNAVDEQEKIEAIRIYHERTGEDLPDLDLHAIVHSVIENQVALGIETPVTETLARLMREGLDRHEAIHAIGSILAVHIFEIVSGSKNDRGSDQYFSEVEKLTAKSWLAQDDSAT